MKKKIAIIGSGIAGLTLANLLKNNSSLDFVLIFGKLNFFKKLKLLFLVNAICFVFFFK